jgi:hypothetical protein
MTRSLASHLAVLIVGLTLGVGAVAVAERGTSAQRATSGERAIAKEVRKLQGLIGTSQYDRGSLRSELQHHIGNPFAPSVKDLLQEICQNTTTGSGVGCL